jgi:MoxR-like ATPase
MDEVVQDLDNLKHFRPSAPLQIGRSQRATQHDPRGYLPDAGLVDAIRVALLLRKPLLLTGEPGTGKTDLAFYLNWKLGYSETGPLIFQARSNSVGRDLFYSYDTLARFRAAQANLPAADKDFLTFNALGQAILLASPPAAIQSRVPSGFEHHNQRQSVVLIDEVDKAPRDFPNDILNELDRMFFTIPELGGSRFEAPDGWEPVVVVTSNSEKTLPGPFLRRCVYYHIPFPDPKTDPKRLTDIVAARIPRLAAESPLLKSAVELFGEIRDPNEGLQRPPATGELLDWLLYLIERGADRQQSLKMQPAVVRESLGALVKEKPDLMTARKLVDTWLAS